MRRLLLAVIVLFTLSQMLGSGCGDRLLTVNIDVLSFMDSTAVTQTYGDDPIIPPGPVPVVVDIEPQRVNLSEGLADVTDIQSVGLHLTSEFANQTGRATLTFQVFISDTLDNPYLTDPYVEEELILEPSTTDTLDVDIAGNEELGELLTGEAVLVGLRMSFNATGSPGNVTGTEKLIRFDATVIAKRHIP